MLNYGAVHCRSTSRIQAEAKSPPFPEHSTIQTFDNPINFGLPSPLCLYGFQRIYTGRTRAFDDPYYVPDPVSLLGPVSESLDNFQLDFGAGFGIDVGMERPCGLKNISAAEISKPSPLVSSAHGRCGTVLPLIRMVWAWWVIPQAGSCPLVHNRSNKEDFLHPSSQKAMASLFTKEDHILAGKWSPRKVFLGNGQNGGTFSSVADPRDSYPWLQKAFFPPLSGSDNHFLNKSGEELSYGNHCGSAGIHPFEHFPANCWPK
ncbi:Detected protein of confused Function [Hibiscus syriacus]|uniref:Detected protein of confused Function n=1 Tax=Hibiscus syriacus TaxID=106335 RepID=A0A6A3AKB8_HIBSY|nr:Detected protein of confused Function [Hibiscus syriacus]